MNMEGVLTYFAHAGIILKDCENSILTNKGGIVSKNILLVLPNEERVFSLVSQTYTQRGGFNTEVVMTRYPDGTRKVKKRIGAKREGFSLEEAGEIAKDLVRYQKMLVALGIPMPDIDAEGFSIRYDPIRNKALVYATSVWTGFDVEYLTSVACARYDKEELDLLLTPIVKQMASLLKCVCGSRISATETTVGIDPKPSNFTIDECGNMWYVDPFPPRYRKEGVPIVEWHPLHTRLGKELGYFKYYDVRGIFLGLAAQLARICPQRKVLFENICIDALAGVLDPLPWQDFISEFPSAPWQVLRNALESSPKEQSTRIEEATAIIRNCFAKKLFGVDYHVYTLRELALELAYAGRMSLHEMEDFFHVSHFEEELPPKQLRALQENLCSFLTPA